MSLRGALILGILLPACTSFSEGWATASRPPRPADHAVLVFQPGQRPDRPYEEIGRVEAGVPSAFATGDDLMRAFTAEARKLGGDAVVDVVVDPDALDGWGAGDSQRPVLSGTVVRWTTDG